jgi:DNA segregation ATPase FtsK/SpoIIIE-like protein
MGRSFLHRSYLDRQANQIERALIELERPAKVQGGRVGERWVRYHLTPVSGTRTLDVAEAAEAVADAIGVAEVRVAEGKEGMALEVPLQRGTELRLLPLLHAIPDLSALTAIIGILKEGKPLLLQLGKRETWNLMISGPAGCGKSELLRTTMISLALTSRRSELGILGIDIGGQELALLEALPHAITDLASDQRFAEELLIWLAEEIFRRGESGISHPNLVMVIDDMGWLLSGRYHEALAALRVIMQRGHQSGVHLLGAMRDPQGLIDADVIHSQGLVRAVPITGDNGQAHPSLGAFRFTTGSEGMDADVAWLSVRDIDTAVRLANAGWRATGAPQTDRKVAS